MNATWKQYEGQAVDGIPLLRLLGGSEASAVYAGELAGSPCAVKLAQCEEAAAQIPLARWQQASKLEHPHLARILQWGRARLDGGSYVYLAMEFAEEELSAVDRPLTPKEIRELLTPAVSALAYLHSQKFAHGRVRPSNILSVNEVLKLSGDAPLKFGERPTPRPAPSAYDAPELANVGVTAQGDVWSLGVTLVEALTKQLPQVDENPPVLPASLKPDSFREVVLGCLERDPARRWTLDNVAQWLERGTMPVPKKAPKRFLLPLGVAAGIVVVGAIAWPHLTRSQAPAAAAPVAAVSNQEVAEQKPAEAPPPQVDTPRAGAEAPVETPAPAAKPPKSANKPREAPAANAAPAPALVAKAKAEPPPTDTANITADAAKPAASNTPAPTDEIPDGVVQPVRPNVPSKARATIHGKVPIFVRVDADAGGAVTEAKVESGGSSKYFADLAVQAARQWKFAPSDGGASWMVRFEFTRNADHPVTLRASRLK